MPLSREANAISPWKPIDTAPKDGSWVWLYFPPALARTCYWEPEWQRWVPVATLPVPENFISPPTHWAPDNANRDDLQTMPA